MPDGEHLVYPDGFKERGDDVHIENEFTKDMTETATNIAKGFAAFRRLCLADSRWVNRHFAAHDAHVLPVSVNPKRFSEQDISPRPWNQLLASRDKMPDVCDFAAVGSQIHLDITSIDTAARAINNLQILHPITGVVTEAGAFRDGRLDVSLREHYLENPSEDFHTPASVWPLLRDHVDEVPHDWREFSRIHGSPSGGPYSEPAPMTAAEIFRRANDMLHAGEIPGAFRVFGEHTDRLRLDYATIECCNMGTAGGNIRKLQAAHNLTAKFLLAVQLCPDTEQQAYTQLFGGPDTIEMRAKQCEVAAENNQRVALYGKEALILTPDGSDEISLPEFLKRVSRFIRTYSPVQLTNNDSSELSATLTPISETNRRAIREPEDAFMFFYMPDSPLTANETQRLAYAAKPDMRAVFRSFAKAAHFQILKAR
jgi:hypothetical protein